MHKLESDLILVLYYIIVKTCVSRILTKILGITHMYVILILKLLAVEQKNLCFKVAQDNLEMVTNDENVFKKFITGKKLWIYGSNLEIKQVFIVEAFMQFMAKKGSQNHVKQKIFSSIMKVLYIMNMLRDIRQSIKNFTLKL